MSDKILSSSGFVHPSSTLHNAVLGAWTEVGAFNVYENVELGDYSYTGQNCIVQNTSIGKFSNIAAHVRIGPTDHPMERPTLHHFTYRRRMFGMDETDDLAFFQHRHAQRCTIGHDTWLGHGVIVMNGVHIGHGAVVGSGAVVTRDIPPYAVAVGVPAKIVKYRFTPEQIKALLELNWWDWSHERIKERFDSFCGSIDDFLTLWKDA